MKFEDLKFIPTDNDPNVDRAVFTSIWGNSAVFRKRVLKASSRSTVGSFIYEIVGDYGNHPPQYSNVHYKNLIESGVQVVLDATWRPEGWKPFTPSDAGMLAEKLVRDGASQGEPTQSSGEENNCEQDEGA